MTQSVVRHLTKKQSHRIAVDGNVQIAGRYAYVRVAYPKTHGESFLFWDSISERRQYCALGIRLRPPILCVREHAARLEAPDLDISVSDWHSYHFLLC